MKTDKELLELAAKAASYNIRWRDMKGGYERALITPKLNGKWWNPIADDGDALRLAVDLDFIVDTSYGRVIEASRLAEGHNDWFYGEVDFGYSNDSASTRRAIVRAAASIGERL